MRSIAIIVLTCLAVSTGAFAIGDWVVSSFGVPSGCELPLGITYDDNNLYVSDGFGDNGDFVTEMFVLSTSGAEVNSYGVGSAFDFVAGLSYGAGSIWGVSTGTKEIYEIDPGDGSILSSFSLHVNNANSNSVVYHNGNLYVSNSASSHTYIYVYSTSGVLQNTFLSHAKYPAGLDIIENAGTDYIFNLGSDDGFFVLHELNGTPHPEFTYLTSSPDIGDYSGDVVFEQSSFSGDDPNYANMWHINKSDSNVYYLQVEWNFDGIRSASLGEIKALFR